MPIRYDPGNPLANEHGYYFDGQESDDMGTTSEQKQQAPAVGRVNDDGYGGMSDYPRITDKQQGEKYPSLSGPKDADLVPEDVLQGHVSEQVSATTTRTYDASPPAPMAPPRVGASGDMATQRAQQLSGVADLYEALPSDGNIARGVSSSGQSGDTRSVDELKDELMRQGGASEADIRWDRLHRGR